jgi:multiple sugar transport system ATP-binding protein
VASITLEGVSKTYPNGFEAVRDLDLEIADGEFMVVVGPSGCGKTSVLRMIAGLEEVTSGTICIGDQVVNDVAPRDRDIAMIFQSYALYPQMSVAQNIGFALRMKKIPKREIEQRVKEAAAVLGISDWLDRKPTQLSGGQRQRVAMGRAIVREPSAFLMDEPLSNLDAKLRVQMRAEVARVQKRIGVATLYVTHDQIEAMTLGHRVAVLRDGVLQQCDTPQVLYDRPSNVFVAGFIGSPAMNLFEGGISTDLGSLSLGSQRIALSPDASRKHPGLKRYSGQAVIIGIRPEDFHTTSGGEFTSTIVGEVELVESLGAEVLVHFSIDARTIQSESSARTESEEEPRLGGSEVSANFVARIEPGHLVRTGDQFKFSISSDKLEFFDLTSGTAIAD